jgi:hypothetical protein
MMFLALRRGKIGRRHDHDLVGRQQRCLIRLPRSKSRITQGMVWRTDRSPP